jgi:hypothetical protein
MRLFLAVVASTAPAASASAATVGVRTVVVDPEAGPVRAVHYIAAPGERNDVFAVAVNDRRVQITDPGAVVSAMGRCSSVDAHTAICRGDLLSARVELGDLDDRARTSRRWGHAVEMRADGGPGSDVLEGGSDYADVLLNGGDGNDRLHARMAAAQLHGGNGDDGILGSPQFDTLEGGAGADLLYGLDGHDDLDGGGGEDVLVGGPGADSLTDGDRDDGVGDAAPGPDTLIGGSKDTPANRPGGDRLSYEQRARSVRVHAGRDPVAGEAGERDSISGIESIIGGDGDDVLVGDHRSNVLVGGRGADTLIGHGGRDDLAGGDGRDHLRGGRDADLLSGAAGIDALSCGAGEDLVNVRRGRDREIVPKSCEQLDIGWDFFGGNYFTRWLWVRPHLTRTQRWWLSLRTACPWVWDDAAVACRGQVTVRETRGRRRLLALGHFRHGANTAQFTVPLALTRTGFRWWTGRPRRAPATVAVRVIAEMTPERPFKWTIEATRRE